MDKHLTESNVRARRGKNIRENIFVICAIQNETVKRKLKGMDITIYDAEKCFNKLWGKECINTLYNNGLQNDNLDIRHLVNLNATG